MQYKQILKLFLAVLVAHVTFPLMAQVAPDAIQGGIPIVAGAGVSNFIIDWGDNPDGHPRQMQGITVWVDWNFYHAPGLLSGLGVEVEGRDIDWDLPPSLSNAALSDTGTNMRQDTGLGGVIYTLRRYRKIHPYAKALSGIGSIDFQPLTSAALYYRHDSRAIAATGAGVEYRVGRNIWVRGDYEYQWWPDLFGRQKALTPNGGTLGVVYHFGPR
jgi:hypothetical protein